MVGLSPDGRRLPLYPAPFSLIYIFRSARLTRTLSSSIRMTTDRKLLETLLVDHVAQYRATSYQDLASRLGSPRHSDHLDVFNGTTPDGIPYTIETNILWDDKAKGHIRVIADLSPILADACLDCFPSSRQMWLTLLSCRLRVDSFSNDNTTPGPYLFIENATFFDVDALNHARSHN